MFAILSLHYIYVPGRKKIADKKYQDYKSQQKLLNLSLKNDLNGRTLCPEYFEFPSDLGSQIPDQLHPQSIGGGNVEILG